LPMRSTVRLNPATTSSTIPSLAGLLQSRGSSILQAGRAKPNRAGARTNRPTGLVMAMTIACLGAAAVSAQPSPRAAMIGETPLGTGLPPHTLEAASPASRADEINPLTNQTIEAERLNQSVQTARQRTRLLEQEVAAERLRVELNRLRLSPSGNTASFPSGVPQDTRLRGSFGLTAGPPGTAPTDGSGRAAGPFQTSSAQSTRPGGDRSHGSARPLAHGIQTDVEPDGTAGRGGVGRPQHGPSKPSETASSQTVALALPRVIGTAESGGRRYALVDTGRQVEIIGEGTQVGALQVQRIAEGRVTINGRTIAPVFADERWPAPTAVSGAVTSPPPARLNSAVTQSEGRGTAWVPGASAPPGSASLIAPGMESGRPQEP